MVPQKDGAISWRVSKLSIFVSKMTAYPSADPLSQVGTTALPTKIGAMTLSITTLSITALSITTLSITALSIRTLSLTTLSITTQHNDTQHNDTQHNDTQHNDTQHKGLVCNNHHNKTFTLC